MLILSPLLPSAPLLFAAILMSSGCRPASEVSEQPGLSGEKSLRGAVDLPSPGDEPTADEESFGEEMEALTELFWERAEEEEPVADRPRAVGPAVAPEGALPSLAPLVERLTPTVVGVTTRSPRAGPGRSPPPGIPLPPIPPRYRDEIGIGSGVIIDPQGLVLTNHHVIIGAESVEVRLFDDRQFDAEILGADPETDIAVLRLRGVEAPLPAARLGQSDNLRVGDYVVAIGNPFGLSLTVTAGIVSAMARVIGTSPFDDFLQTDAAINPGNSGGPLFDLDGRVVGINTAIVAPGEGIGFAVPIDLVRALLPQIVERGRVVRGYLGLVIQDLTPKLAGELGVDVDGGAMVVGVERRGPAERAGLKVGDIIVAVEDERVEGAASLSRKVARMEPADTATLEVLRDKDSKTIRIELGKRPGDDVFSAPR